MNFVLGLDLGQTSDPSALCCLRRDIIPDTGKQKLVCVGLHRYPLNTPYTSPDPLNPGIGQQLKTMLSQPPLSGSILAVDNTGVGRAVFDVLLSLSLPVTLIPVTITAGSQGRMEPDGSTFVPKADLVACLQVLLQSGRLEIRPELKLASVLLAEFDNFRVKVTASANETFNAREGQHDDLLLSLAIAAFIAEKFPPFTRESIGSAGRRGAARVPGGESLGGDFRRPRPT